MCFKMGNMRYFLFNKLFINSINRNTLWCNSRSELSSSSSSPSKFFVTTPIFYANAEPHIGHLHTLMVADAFHRFQQLQGHHDTIFSTGTDEHGIKIQRAAEAKGIEPKLFCDEITEKFKRLCTDFNSSNTVFVRTTENIHESVVQEFWKRLQDSGNIYKSKYQGWYCASDEAFVTNVEDVTKDGLKVKVSAESGNEIEWIEEENYMFKLSEFQEPLLKWLDGTPKVIKPDLFHSLIKQEVSRGLQDLSISRPSKRLSWAIPVPGDDSQTIYVWLDALVNYLTVSGYPELKIWPPDIQVIGKDILKFHAIYWPAFLMAAGLAPPKKIFCHSHWTIDNLKMSKSKGNVVDPFQKRLEVSSEGFRYFLLRQGMPQTDGNYNDPYVAMLIDSELVNTFGNLLGRSTGLNINKAQIFPSARSLRKFDTLVSQKIESDVKALPDFCHEHYSNGTFCRGVEEIMRISRNVNSLYQEVMPWKLIKVKSEYERWEWIQFLTLESLRIMSILLQPIIPLTMNRALDSLGVPGNERSWHHTKFNEGKLKDTPLGTSTGPLIKRIRK